MPEIYEGKPMNPAEQAEFDQAMQAERPRPFLPDSAKEKLADETAKILRSSSPEPGRQQVEAKPEQISDTAQHFIDRLSTSKSVDESRKIINEVLIAAERKEIPPYEATKILDGLDQMKNAA